MVDVCLATTWSRPKVVSISTWKQSPVPRPWLHIMCLIMQRRCKTGLYHDSLHVALGNDKGFAGRATVTAEQRGL